MNGPPSRELTRQERAAIRKLVTDLCANHDNQDRLCLPLDCPCYMLHKWWTGSFCRYFQEAVLPVDPALESAITGEDTSLKQKTCPVCGKAICLLPARPIVRIPAEPLPDGNPSGNASAGSGKIRGNMSAT